MTLNIIPLSSEQTASGNRSNAARQRKNTRATSQREITRLLKAVQGAGLKVDTFVLEAGRLTITAGGFVAPQSELDLDSELARWEQRCG